MEESEELPFACVFFERFLSCPYELGLFRTFFNLLYNVKRFRTLYASVTVCVSCVCVGAFRLYCRQ